MSLLLRMARVNDGNLLQHATECHLAERLAAAGDGRLRLVATHAMAPFEPARSEAVHEHNRRLRTLLADPQGDAPVVRAYGATGASTARYPNTAELLAALLGRDALSGVLCESDPEAHLALEDAWRDGVVRIEGRSWRDVLASGDLLPPEHLDRPWLVTLDPFGWLLDGEAKREARGPYLVREDLEALRPVLAAHVRSGRPGAVAVFVYEADPAHAKGFRAQVLRLADRLGLERALVGVAAPRATRHLGVVMSSLEDLAAETAEAADALLADR